MKEWIKLKEENYMKDVRESYGNGMIDFSPDSMKDFNSNDFKSYDEYLEVQRLSVDKSRKCFETCYYNDYGCYFYGRIERTTQDRVLFKSVLVSGMYHDGIGFDGKEDHVWIEKAGFENFKVGDCVKFTADVYRYIKKNNGKLIDYALKEADDISEVESYQVPTDEELIEHQIEMLVCETCLFYNNCYMGNCVADSKYREEVLTFLKEFDPGRFTPITVIAAYEIAGQVYTQLSGGELKKEGPDYELYNKILIEASKLNGGCVWPVRDAIAKLIYPEKPRIYIDIRDNK